ncbi:MAG: hypothetical protein ONB44_02120 [candidate division KSB1 bacterium]|nr:hypothetical protein [candidate division KSB1 bacterium]
MIGEKPEAASIELFELCHNLEKSLVQKGKDFYITFGFLNPDAPRRALEWPPPTGVAKMICQPNLERMAGAKAIGQISRIGRTFEILRFSNRSVRQSHDRVAHGKPLSRLV